MRIGIDGDGQASEIGNPATLAERRVPQQVAAGAAGFTAAGALRRSAPPCVEANPARPIPPNWRNFLRSILFVSLITTPRTTLFSGQTSSDLPGVYGSVVAFSEHRHLTAETRALGPCRPRYPEILKRNATRPMIPIRHHSGDPQASEATLPFLLEQVRFRPLGEH